MRAFFAESTFPKGGRLPLVASPSPHQIRTYFSQERAMQHAFESQPRIRPIPQQRVIEKMDEYMSRRDYAGAERHLLYWLEEARVGGDLRGALLLRNEMVGHYRKTGERDKALESAEAALLYAPQRCGMLFSEDGHCVGWSIDGEMQLHPLYENAVILREPV
jgi:hypothetical protein